jgi:hypothetical protein
MSREIEIGENLAICLIAFAFFGVIVIGAATCGKTNDSIDCVKAGGQWRVSESGHSHCERK